MNIEGDICRLRAVEPGDVDVMYAWENDESVWCVSGTTVPLSRDTLTRFVEVARLADLYVSRQLRLIIETREGEPAGTIDIFEFEPQHHRVGVGILIADKYRRRGLGADAVATLCRYLKSRFDVHTVWCDVGADNVASRALFERCGFEVVGCKRDWMWTAEGYRDEIMMQRIL